MLFCLCVSVKNDKKCANGAQIFVFCIIKPFWKLSWPSEKFCGLGEGIELHPRGEECILRCVVRHKVIVRDRCRRRDDGVLMPHHQRLKCFCFPRKRQKHQRFVILISVIHFAFSFRCCLFERSFSSVRRTPEGWEG